MECNCNNFFKKFSRTHTLTKREVKLLTFSPPSFSLYSLEEIDQKDKNQTRKKQEKYTAITKKYIFKHKKFELNMFRWIATDCYKIRKKNNKNIVLIHIRNLNLKESDFTLLYSQGNSTNLGVAYSTLVDISSALKVNIISYDYSGYGESEGKPSDTEICSDIEEVGDFVKNGLKIDFDKVILFSKSLGSIPSIHLGSLKAYNNLRAIIFLSPITTGIKLINQKNLVSVDDIEKANIVDVCSKLKDISCSVFVIHGKKDETVPIKFTEEFVKKLSKVTCWYPKGGNHDNIITEYRDRFYSKCSYFFNSLRYYMTKDFTSVVSPSMNIKNFSLRFEENYIKSSPDNNENLDNVEQVPFKKPISFAIENPSLIKRSDTINSKAAKNVEKQYIGINSLTNSDEKFDNSKRLTEDFTYYDQDINRSDDYEMDERFREQEKQFDLINKIDI